LNGNTCDLNHIDVSRVDNFYRLFADHDVEGDPYDDTPYEDFSGFNGDISQWDVSHVTNMEDMFYRSEFNGDISHWNVSKVVTMEGMFYDSNFNRDISQCYDSNFNRDISQWDVSNVKNMEYILNKFTGKSVFEGDLSNWKPYNLKFEQYDGSNNFSLCLNIPYWALIQDNEDRKKAIDNYWLNKELTKNLNVNEVKEKKMKI
jgi:hypothetical protein